MMQIMKNVIKLLPYLLVFVLGGIVASITRSWGIFIYENKFNIFELFYFVLSAGIALFITNRIDDALQRRRSQKDIILKKMEEVDYAVKGLNELFTFDENKVKLSNTPFLSKVKTIGMWAKRYEESVTRYYSELNEQTGYIRLNTRNLVRVCTKTSDERPEDISCENDIWTYSDSKFVQIKDEMEKIRTICYNNMILLNNYA